MKYLVRFQVLLLSIGLLAVRGAFNQQVFYRNRLDLGAQHIGGGASQNTAWRQQQMLTDFNSPAVQPSSSHYGSSQINVLGNGWQQQQQRQPLPQVIFPIQQQQLPNNQQQHILPQQQSLHNQQQQRPILQQQQILPQQLPLHSQQQLRPILQHQSQFQSELQPSPSQQQSFPQQLQQHKPAFPLQQSNVPATPNSLNGHASMLGGWQQQQQQSQQIMPANANQAEQNLVSDIARWVASSLSSYTNLQGDYTALTVRNLKTQIVAGTNYKFTLDLLLSTPQDNKFYFQTCEIAVFDQPWTKTRNFLERPKCNKASQQNPMSPTRFYTKK